MALDKTTAVISACITTAIVVLLFVILQGSIHNQRHYYASVDRCTEKGGTWIPMRDSTGVCFQR